MGASVVPEDPGASLVVGAVGEGSLVGTSVVSIGSSGSVTTGSVVGGGGAVVLVAGAEVDVVESIGSSGSVMVVI